MTVTSFCPAATNSPACSGATSPTRPATGARTWCCPISSARRCSVAAEVAASASSVASVRRRPSTSARCWAWRARASAPMRRASAASASWAAASLRASARACRASTRAMPPASLSAVRRRSRSVAKAAAAAASSVLNCAPWLAAWAVCKSSALACSREVISCRRAANCASSPWRRASSSRTRKASGPASRASSRSPGFTSAPSTGRPDTRVPARGELTAWAACCTSSRALFDTSTTVTAPSTNQLPHATSTRAATAQAQRAGAAWSPDRERVVWEKGNGKGRLPQARCG